MTDSAGLPAEVATPTRSFLKLYVQGPYGAGKTSLILHRLAWLQETCPAEGGGTVVLLPANLARPEFWRRWRPFASRTTNPPRILTPHRLASTAVTLAWPELAAEAGFANPQDEPVLITREHVQYILIPRVKLLFQQGRLAGAATKYSRRERRVVREAIEILRASAMYGLTFQEARDRLIDGLQPGPYREGVAASLANVADLLADFRRFCLANRLIDESLLISLFYRVLERDDLLNSCLLPACRHLLVENLEDQTYNTHALIRTLAPRLESLLVTVDEDAGVRYFDGGYPEGCGEIARLCDLRLRVTAPAHAVPTRMAAGLDTVHGEGDAAMADRIAWDGEWRIASSAAGGGQRVEPAGQLRYASHEHNIDMLAGAADVATRLVREGVEPGDIALVAPIVTNQMRVTLGQHLGRAGVSLYSHRPSRALHEEPATRALLCLARIAYPGLAATKPSELDLRVALIKSIGNLSGLQAHHLARAWHPHWESGETGSFHLPIDVGERVGAAQGRHWDDLRNWLVAYRSEESTFALHTFLARVIHEVLGRPQYGFDRDAEDMRVASHLARSAAVFRELVLKHGIYADFASDPGNEAARLFTDLVEEGLLGDPYVPDEDPPGDSVFLAPVTSLLMRYRSWRHQVWLDIGSELWGQRLRGQLAHPWVLSPTRTRGGPWVDAEESQVSRVLRHRFVMGLARRARDCVWLMHSDYNERGSEQRGPLLPVYQYLVNAEDPDRTGPVQEWLFGEPPTND